MLGFFFLFGEIKSNKNNETELRKMNMKLSEGKIKDQKNQDKQKWKQKTSTEHYLLCDPRLKVKIKYVSTENEQLSINEELQKKYMLRQLKSLTRTESACVFKLGWSFSVL